MAELKKALTYEQQIQHLKTKHNITIDNEDKALSIIKSISYYRLSAYGIGLTKEYNSEEYVDGTTLSSIYELYLFDSKFRNILMHTIEQIEIQFRTQVSNYLALKYGEECHMHSECFQDKYNKDGKSIYNMIINNFRDECVRQSNTPMVKHHMDKYGGHFPIWVAVELFTFGNLTSLFSIMNPEDQQKIADLYKTKAKYLKSWLLSLVEVRNICAHYGRIYNMPLKQTPFLYSEHTKYRTKMNKVFPLLLVIKRMLIGAKWWNEFFADVQDVIGKYSDVINLSFVGFPKDWVKVLSD